MAACPNAEVVVLRSDVSQPSLGIFFFGAGGDGGANVVAQWAD